MRTTSSRTQLLTGEGLSLMGAVVVGAAALMLAAASVEEAMSGIAAATSSDGLSRIFGPFTAVGGLICVAFAITGLVLSWRTARSRAQAKNAVIGGVLVLLASAFIFAPPPAYQELPAFAFALAVVGIGPAIGGWLLATVIDHGPSTVEGLSGGLVGFATAAVAVMPIVVGVAMSQSAARDAELALPPAERARFLGEAERTWDSPFQRVTYLELAVTHRRESVRCGTTTTVEAFTLFGMSVDYLSLDECGVTP